MAKKTRAGDPVVGVATTGTAREQVNEETAAADVSLVVDAAEQAPTPADDEHTLYVSHKDEPQTFDIRLDVDTHVRGYWNANEDRLFWRVPDKLHDRFKRHYFVTTGRIVEVKKTA